MRFESKNISISDSEFGLTITFSDKKDREYKPDADINDLVGNYILFQRTYAEDDYDESHSYIESSNFKKFGELKDYKIDLHKNRLIIHYKKEKMEVLFDVEEKRFQKIKEAMRNIAIQNGELTIHE